MAKNERVAKAAEEKNEAVIVKKLPLGVVVTVKPLLRGWIHAIAAVGSLILTVVLAWASHQDWPRLVSVLIFGISLTLLYTVSAVYHIGTNHWSPSWERFWRRFDHANIYAVIAGTYTPFAFNLLSDWWRMALLLTVWIMAVLGIVAVTVFAHLISRSVKVGLYIGMGWVGLFSLPAMLSVLPWQGVLMLIGGGVLYTVGALIYGWRWPDPFPRFFGFHEIFHLFVVAGSAVFAVAVWLWVLPYPRA